MSDFLTRLAQRTLGEAPVVRPRLPGLFAPLNEEATPGNDAVAFDFQERPTAHALVPLSRPALAREDTTQAAGTKRARPPALPAAGEAASDREPARKTPEQAAQTGSGSEDVPGSARAVYEPSPSLPRSPGERSEIAGASSVLSVEQAAPRGQLARRRLAQPLQRAGAKEKASDRGAVAFLEREAQAPAVHITIGRVEVRANISAPPATRPRPEHKPALSLRDYLERGTGKS